MTIYRIADDKIVSMNTTTFDQAGIMERQDLQRMLKTDISVISGDSPDDEILVVAEEFGEWEGSKRRIDLLGIDKEANLVVIELKRTEDGGHMDLQAIRYAAMISNLTFERTVTTFSKYLQNNQKQNQDARTDLLNFLNWPDPKGDQFGQNVKIILVSADFSPELTTSVMWLNDSGLDIRCVRIQPYDNNGETLLDVQTIIPIPEAADYQMRFREKQQEERAARSGGKDYTKYDVRVGGIPAQKGQNKRWAMFHLISGIFAQNPEREIIRQIEHETTKKLFFILPGKLSLEEVLAEIEAKYHDRYFLKKESEIFHVNDETYLLTNQWGIETADTARTIIELLKKLLPGLDIEFEPAAD